MPRGKLTYEKAVVRLEEIVAAIEDGKKSLDDIISLYKEGIDLANFCTERLNRAKGEISILQMSDDIGNTD